MKNILLTGATGYLGAKIFSYFSEKGYNIFALCHSLPDKINNWNLNNNLIIVGDINNSETFKKIESLNPEIIVHTISLDHKKSEAEPKIVAETNVFPTWNLLNHFSKKNLKKFIYFSTFQVYGNIPNSLITELQPTFPKNNYGLTHLLSENICNYYHSTTDVDCISIRLTNSYGSPVFKDNNCWWLVINDLCKTAWNEKKIQLLSDGSPLRDFIHISDVCKVLELLINKTLKEPSNILNVGSGKTFTILELANIVKQVFLQRYNENIPIFIQGIEQSNSINPFSEIPRFVINTERLKKLEFNNPVDLEIGINELFNYLDKSVKH